LAIRKAPEVPVEHQPDDQAAHDPTTKYTAQNMKAIAANRHREWPTAPAVTFTLTRQPGHDDVVPRVGRLQRLLPSKN
jgi:hypothetical protein